jgi:nitronate monooxygenase
MSSARAAGVLLFAQVQSVAQAQRAAAAGVDLIIAQGTEAGGHTGLAGTLALVPAVVDQVGAIPVVAAGGIADGRGLAAVLMLGAVGAWMGTRFVASQEWGGGAWEQAAVLRAGADDTIRTTVFDTVRDAPFPPGIADRVLRNPFIERWEAQLAAIPPRRAELQAEVAAAAQQRDPSAVDISAGVAAGLIHTALPAAAIIHSIIAEAELALRRVPAELLTP